MLERSRPGVTFENGGELLDYEIFNPFPVNHVTGARAKRRHTAVSDPTRDDQTKEVKVGGDVEREPVTRNPA